MIIGQVPWTVGSKLVPQRLARGSFTLFDLGDGLVHQLDCSLPMTALVRKRFLQGGPGFTEMRESRLHMGLPGKGWCKRHGH